MRSCVSGGGGGAAVDKQRAERVVADGGAARRLGLDGHSPRHHDQRLRIREAMPSLLLQ